MPEKKKEECVFIILRLRKKIRNFFASDSKSSWFFNTSCFLNLSYILSRKFLVFLKWRYKIYSTSVTQPWGAGRRPYWMPVRVS